MNRRRRPRAADAGEGAALVSGDGAALAASGKASLRIGRGLYPTQS
jgi:hypothetical protein